MALGVPVVATLDAVAGMELIEAADVLLGRDDDALAKLAIRLLEDAGLAKALSRSARERVERLFSMENTYGRWMREIAEWLPQQRTAAS